MVILLSKIDDPEIEKIKFVNDGSSKKGNIQSSGRFVPPDVAHALEDPLHGL